MDVELIHATASGIEQRFVSAEADIEVGDDNTFQIRVEYTGYEEYDFGDLIYIPGTEYGGRIGVIRSETESNIIMLSGYTWRGILQKKIITPPKGSAYYTVSGDVGTLTARILNSFVGGSLFTAPGAYGLKVSSFKFPRYCSVIDGLEKMYAKVNARADIYYDQASASVVVRPHPVRNLAADIQMDADNDINFIAEKKTDGVNHLICLGSGQLAARTVVNLYADSSGNISQKKTLYGDKEIVAVYDNPNAESTEELINDGTEALEEMQNYSMFEATVSDSIEEILEIGDIISGKDYITGITVAAPIRRAIMTVVNGVGDIEYSLEGSDS